MTWNLVCGGGFNAVKYPLCPTGRLTKKMEKMDGNEDDVNQLISELLT
jgi:hypothetical protein